VPGHPLKDTAEIEITCPRCGYRMIRTAARLRRKTEIFCPSCGSAVAAGIDEGDREKSGTSDDH